MPAPDLNRVQKIANIPFPSTHASGGSFWVIEVAKASSLAPRVYKLPLGSVPGLPLRKREVGGWHLNWAALNHHLYFPIKNSISPAGSKKQTPLALAWAA